MNLSNENDNTTAFAGYSNALLRLLRISGIPWAILSDIYSGKTILTDVVREHFPNCPKHLGYPLGNCKPSAYKIKLQVTCVGKYIGDDSMTKRDDIYGNDAMARFYNDVVNSPALQAASKFANSSAMQAAQQIANSSSVQLAMKYVNFPAYKAAAQQASMVQGILDCIRPAYLDVPLYNESAIRTITEITRATSEMQSAVNYILQAS